MKYEDVLTSMRCGCDDPIARLYAVKYFEIKDARIRELKAVIADLESRALLSAKGGDT